MAHIIGGVGTTHVPSIGGAIAKGKQTDEYWRPFFDMFPPVRGWLGRSKPDIAVVIYNDHGLNFFLDKMPTFAVGAAAEYRNADEGWGLPVVRSFAGDPEFSWHLIESLVADEFDIVSCQEMLVDHAFVVPMQLLYPDVDPTGAGAGWPVRVVPISVNTVQHPIPSAARCYKFGKAIGRAIRSYQQDANVLIMGTGGLSHQLEGKRAGFINKDFDRLCLDRLVDDPAALTGYSSEELVDLAGSQGVELLNWLVMRGALGEHVSPVSRSYHVPISNTASAVLALAAA